MDRILTPLIQGFKTDGIQYKGILSFDTSKPDGNPRKLLNSSKMLNYGWKSEIQLFDGLESTYKWFQENIKIN